MDGRPLFPLADHRFRRGAVEPRQRLVRHGRDVLVFFFKQKTAYEMSLRDGVQTCALPICLPHYWLDPENGKRIAKEIAGKFSEVRPNDRAGFQQRLADFTTRLDAAAKRWLAE